MPISSPRCMLNPGSVKVGGTWQVEHAAGPMNSFLPRAAAAASNVPFGGFGAASASW